MDIFAKSYEGAKKLKESEVKDLDEAINEFKRRQRRFGGV